MYQSRLGFSLLPPKSVRQAFSNVFGAGLSAIERAATQRLNTIAPSQAPSPVQQFVQDVPGGTNTLLTVGAIVAAIFILPKILRR
jgi:hypothetical protein